MASGTPGKAQGVSAAGRLGLAAAALLVGLLSAALSVGAAGDFDATVNLESGRLSGRIAGDMRIFLGIPYAQPPTGDLRWKAPGPPRPWEGVRDATAFGPACAQTGPLENGSSEDCLTLNVWTPLSARSEKLPVMVWIHGGGFTFGASSQPEYEGSELARQGVVVVTVNYRLGPLGFLVHPGLMAESEAGGGGNYGLLDQIEALRWVRRNIAACGGDPDNVTIFGQSAGSRSVSLLTLSPLAAGLFKRAIAQSGGPIIGSEYLSPAFNGDMAAVSAMGRLLGERLGCADKPDELACMRSKSAMEVLQATATETSIFKDGLFFAPVFDGTTLPRDPAAALNDATKPHVPMIVGSTGNEGTTYLRGESGLTTARYEAFLKARFGEKWPDALAMFPARGDGDVPRAIDAFITVAVNAQPARYEARSLERAGSEAWLYRFTRRPKTARALEMGAFHGVDLAYVFGNMKQSDGYEQADRDLSRQMMAYWVNFARTGNPNGPGLVEWPTHTSATDLNLNFADHVWVEQHLYNKQCDFIGRVSRFRLEREVPKPYTKPRGSP
ncbi:carboxylesterase family protein [Desulfovibrio sulfodismutans]|uniref:Carboxylesterase family protein n=1 Tax=Desulfolutivibrio sulfodismutans TaxID=63561 RepID=A0A7K3NH28_9BACT|nr:carboxylesterase/lipase family protein [Desulfolutivibrio sulfodismutans]NDY55506.1 carboxylesterase family protein [Desulfolutivibrio sulfodismutans]